MWLTTQKPFLVVLKFSLLQVFSQLFLRETFSKLMAPIICFERIDLDQDEALLRAKTLPLNYWEVGYLLFCTYVAYHPECFNVRNPRMIPGTGMGTPSKRRLGLSIQYIFNCHRLLMEWMLQPTLQHKYPYHHHLFDKQGSRNKQLFM